MTAVRARDLVKHYGDTAAVRGVSLEVAHGEIVGLLGPNGAGKTSTLECLLGLRTPDAGSVAIEGSDTTMGAAGGRARVGAVLQSTTLQDHITPREALRLFAALHGQPRARADAVLEEFALADQARTAFAALSGGQRQRLALALAFVHAPRVLVLDEPTAGLDPAARRDLHDRIRARRDAGCAVLLSTHDMAEAQQLCDRLVLMDRGRILATGTPGEVIARAGLTAHVRVRARPAPSSVELGALPGVASCVDAGDTRLLHTTDPARTLAALAAVLARSACTIEEIHVAPPSLEDAFLHLTGRRFDAEGGAR